MAFLKFIDKKGADSFISGIVQFGRLKEYLYIEKKKCVGKNDEMEGKYYTTKYQTPQGKGVNFTIDANKQKRNFALCLYHLNNKYSTSRIEEMFEFGEYVVKIEDELEFDKRIKNGAKENKYQLYSRDVLYYRDESIKDEMKIMDLMTNSLDDLSFIKRKEIFSYQNEYRYLIVDELEERMPDIIKKLELELIPKDPNDNKNVIMEIRGAAGGDEGNIFAGDLYRMYVKYAESQGWKVEVMEAEESEAGGFSLISFNVIGDGVYGKLKYESGSHRVQRVPKTETQGRVHTSTATVLVMPEMEEVDVQINKSDLRIDTYRASGAGGQHINKTDSAVRITHLPTGIVATSQDGRSQHDNRDKAMKALVARVYDYFQSQQTEAIDSERKSKVGTGDRAEKIRTYNYPQNRVTDHRIGLTIQQLDRIIEGKLDDIITALINEDQRLKLEGQK